MPTGGSGIFGVVSAGRCVDGGVANVGRIASVVTVAAVVTVPTS
jgi:hypothetical protein